MLAYRRSDWPKLVGLALLYAVTAKASMVFAVFSGIVSLFWIPSGVALAILLIGGIRLWPGVLVGSMLINSNAYTLLPSFMLGFGNALEVLVAAWMLTRDTDFNPKLGRARDFSRLLFLAAILAPIAPTLLAAYGITSGRVVSASMFQSIWLHLWMGDMFSILFLTPLILIWRQPIPARPSGMVLAELVLLFLLTVSLGQSTFMEWVMGMSSPVPSAFLACMFVIWAATRFGRRTTLLVLFVVLMQTVAGVITHTGLFAHGPRDTSFLGLWVYLVVLVAVGMALAVSTDERYVNQRHLNASRAQFIAFMNNFPGGAYIKDWDRRYVFVNRTFEFLDGVKRTLTNCINKTNEELDLYQIQADLLPLIQQDDEAVLQNQQVTSREVVVEHSSGMKALLLIKFPVIADDARVLVGGITLDISERKRAEARVERLTHLYQALSEINQGIMRLADADALFPLVCQVAVRYGGFKTAWIGRLDGDHIVPVAQAGQELTYLDGLVISSRADVPEGLGPTGTVFRTGQHIVLNDLAQHDNMAPWRTRIQRCNFNSCAAFPITRGQLSYAVFNVYHDLANAFDAESVALLDDIASDVSFALDNLDRQNQLQLGQQALLTSEQHFRTFFERSSVGMVTTRPDQTFIDVNPAICELLGYSHAELLQKNWVELTHPDDLPMNLMLYQRVLRDESDDVSLDAQMLRRDGGIVYTHVTARCLRHPDRSIDYLVVLIQNVSERKQAEQKLWSQANFDGLTGLPNRHRFIDCLQQEIGQARQTKLSLGLLFIDLDHFKEVNDTLGHAQGDQLLVESARRIKSCVRDGDTVARLGGDEFMIILAGLQDTDRIEPLAHIIMRKLASVFQLGSENRYVSASIGITLYPADGEDAEQLMRNADQAMYAAKNLGRNRFSYFTPELQMVAQARQRMIGDLRNALPQQELRLYFQPIVDLTHNHIVKAEALIRWQHPQRGLISPAEFIPLAEETGMIIEIGKWVFREAAIWVAQWRARTGVEIQVSVNASPVEFNAESYDPNALVACLQQLDLP
ncbi:MAG: diguanylate cyclase, partial [Herbaspirillum sp.]